MGLVLFVLFIFFIILLSAIVSGSEAAVLSVTLAKVKALNKSNKQKAKFLLNIKKNLQKYIITIVVLNNIINIIGSIYVGLMTVKLFGNAYVGLVSGVLTFLIIIFAEIIPKLYGEQMAPKFSLMISKPLFFIAKFLSPLIFIIEKIISFFVNKKTVQNDSSISEGEIREMAMLGKEQGVLNPYESQIINKAFDLASITADELMIPKHEVVVIRENEKYKNVIKIAQSTGFTRFPIYSENDEILGIINVKDLLKYHTREKSFSIKKILRPTFFIPENITMLDLQQRFKKEKTHMAIVVNEHGDFIGIITLEDTLEILVGDIEDEFDKFEPSEIKKLDKNTYLISGECSIIDLEDKFKITFKKKHDDFTTLNGFLINRLKRIPKVKDKVSMGKYKFVVTKADKTKVLEVKLKID